MATFNSELIAKKLRHRGPHAGKEFTVSGNFIVRAGAPIATTDLLRMVPLGENQRPIRLTISALPISGTPVMTNPSFSVGVIADGATNFTRADGSVYVPVATSAVVLAASAALVANTKTHIEVPRPVADSVSKYGPFFVTLTPSGAGAFSVAGGDIQLKLEVVTVGENRTDTPVYDTYLNTKVKN